MVGDSSEVRVQPAAPCQEIRKAADSLERAALNSSSRSLRVHAVFARCRSNRRSFNLALCNCDFEVPALHPNNLAISSCS